MDLTRRHVNALREQEVSRGKRDGVTMVHEVLRVLRGRTAQERDRVASLRERRNGRQGVSRGVDRRGDFYGRISTSHSRHGVEHC